MYCKTLALLSLAIVATAETVCKKEVLVKSASDIASLYGCYEAVVISKTELVSVDLVGLTSVGNLTVRGNDKLASVQLPALKSAQILNFRENFILDEINVPALKSAKSIHIVDNPKLQQMNFAAGLEHVNVMDVSNTGISTLKGLGFNELETVIVTANPNLKKLDLFNLTSITGDLTVDNNNANFDFLALKLATAGEIQINNVTTLNLTSLKRVKNLDFSYNFFEELTLPNVTYIGATLSIIGNSQLKNLSFPELEEISGSLFVANNSALREISGFPDLETIGGSLSVAGAITNITLPDLKKVKGVSSVKTTEQFNCTALRAIIEKVTNSTQFNCTSEVVKVHDDKKNHTSEVGTDGKDGKDDKKSPEETKKNTANTIRGGLAVVVGIAVSLFM